MKYCQAPKCHEYRTKDRIRGTKGDKHYETRKRTIYFNSFCSQQCQYDWFNKFGKLAVDHFGRIHEPKRVGCDSAWYKDCKYNYNNRGSDSNYDHYIVNDLLGQRIPITQEQYTNCNNNNIKDLVRP